MARGRGSTDGAPAPHAGIQQSTAETEPGLAALRRQGDTRTASSIPPPGSVFKWLT